MQHMRQRFGPQVRLSQLQVELVRAGIVRAERRGGGGKSQKRPCSLQLNSTLRHSRHPTQHCLLCGQVPELDVWRMDIDQPPPGTTAALSDWLIGEMAGFLARGSSGGSRLKTQDTQALRDDAAPVGSGRRRVGSERTGRRGSPDAPSNSLSARDFGARGDGTTDDA